MAVRFVIHRVVHTERPLIEGFRIIDSAYRHGIRESEIWYVLDAFNATRRVYDLHEDEDGSSQDKYRLSRKQSFSRIPANV